MRHRALRALLFIALATLASHADLASSQVESARPWLGVAIAQGTKGVMITDVLRETPAEAAGLKKGDEITAVDATRIQTPEELIRTVQAQGIGNTVTVHFLRANKPTSLKVKLVARPDQLELLKQKLVGKPVQPFHVQVVHGNDPGESAKLKGKVVLLEFWATWCPACRATHPRLSQWARERRKDGLVVLAISDEDEATLKSYATKAKVDFNIGRDLKQDMQRDWMVSAIPMLAVIDRNGTVAFATIGGGSYLEEAIAEAEKLLAAPAR